MTMPRDYEKEALALTKRYRAHMDELNLVNAEVIAHDNAYKPLREEYDRMKADMDEKWRKLDAVFHAGDGARQQLIECRSAIQQIQAELLNVMIELMSRGHE